MAKTYGKRLVPEYLITKLEELEPGGGGEYTAGTGIEISEENEITANIKAGSGIVVDTDLTDDSIVVMVDQADIPYKSDLATVATTGDYNDLTNKPAIPTITILDISTSVTFTSGQIANFIANPGNFLFKEADQFNGDDYFRINTITSGAIQLTKTWVNSSTTLYSEVFYIYRNGGNVVKYNYTTNVPTTATSTSTVTPTTETLTFTYSDNTTGTITFITAATVSTTTTLS